MAVQKEPVQLSRPVRKKKITNSIAKETYEVELQKAATSISRLFDEKDSSTIESELLTSLRNLSNVEKNDSSNLKNVLSGFSITSSQQEPKLHEKPYFRTKSVDSANGFLHKEEKLGIFDQCASVDTCQLPLWKSLKEREIKLSVSQSPSNAFQEMILWTENKSLWTFPIDNEVGLEEEKKVGFQDHIYFEHHLNWCPKKGPIRHFMELVVTGLSKNPHLTVARKTAHIQWYQKYFHEKETILREVGAI